MYLFLIPSITSVTYMLSFKIMQVASLQFEVSATPSQPHVFVFGKFTLFLAIKNRIENKNNGNIRSCAGINVIILNQNISSDFLITWP